MELDDLAAGPFLQAVQGQRRVTGNVFRPSGGGYEFLYEGGHRAGVRRKDAMTDSPSRQVRALAASHAADRDGGYALIDDLTELLGKASGQQKHELEAFLLDLVLTRDPSLWAVALEALVEGNAQATAAALYESLHDNQPAEWRQLVTHALIRMGYRPGRQAYLRYIGEELRHGEPSALPLLASFARLDANTSLEIAAGYFADALADEREVARVKGYLPAIVRAFAEIDPELAGRLVEATGSRRAAAGERLRELVGEYLAKGFVEPELGRTAVLSMRRSIGHEHVARPDP